MMRLGRRDLCNLCSRDSAVTSICNIRICAGCVARIRAIAADDGIVVDEELLAGKLRKRPAKHTKGAESRNTFVQNVTPITELSRDQRVHRTSRRRANCHADKLAGIVNG